MTIEQIEARLRALELVSKGFDYVATKDAADAKDDAEKAAATKAAHDAARDRVDASDQATSDAANAPLFGRL